MFFVSLLSFRWKSHFYKGRHTKRTHIQWCFLLHHGCLLKLTSTFCIRFIDRPEQRISLEDFKSFLLESQKVFSRLLDIYILYCRFVFFPCSNACLCLLLQEMWATDNNKVQEFMFGYLKDPLREVEQPYFQQDEVCAPRCLTLSFPPFSHLCSCVFFLGLRSLTEKCTMFS